MVVFSLARTLSLLSFFFLDLVTFHFLSSWASVLFAPAERPCNTAHCLPLNNYDPSYVFTLFPPRARPRGFSLSTFVVEFMAHHSPFPSWTSRRGGDSVPPLKLVSNILSFLPCTSPLVLRKIPAGPCRSEPFDRNFLLPFRKVVETSVLGGSQFPS